LILFGAFLISAIPPETKLPYVLRKVPREQLEQLLPASKAPRPGDIALARVLRIGKNVRLELANGRLSSLFEGDLVAVAFGNRYATLQFEGYSKVDGIECDLLSMGGLAGLVHTKAGTIADATRLEILGMVGGPSGKPLNLGAFAEPSRDVSPPRCVAVCGSSMDSGKTHTARSIIRGLRRDGVRVAGIKLTGTASGRDTWSFLDAGAEPAIDFIDAGWPSTYLCTTWELLAIHRMLIGKAAEAGAQCAVIEIADGLLQQETLALLQCQEFTRQMAHWVFVTGDPLAAASGVEMLRQWRIEPLAISGLISTRPLASREAEAATGVRVITDRELQHGILNAELVLDASSEEVQARYAS